MRADSTGDSRPFVVLHVEDNPADVELVKQVVGRSDRNLSVTAVSCASDALAYLRGDLDLGTADRPDFVLLDLNLPDSDGYELLEQIRSMPASRSLPVIVLSGSESQTDIQRAYELHANAYLIKPMHYPELQSVLERTFDFWAHAAALPNRHGV
ncbi:response regulator, receiver [Haloferax mucosum ATCC BAA-1512]|uniref:Response regulator, receiver n=2 Tax=Haloferax mucosum TaxID=403181 RepID=M0IIB8_9EURY|nr:response regulator, receiver [Haloferax mucosum ATCC BAA-1512]